MVLPETTTPPLFGAVGDDMDAVNTQALDGVAGHDGAAAAGRWGDDEDAVAGIHRECVVLDQVRLEQRAFGVDSQGDSPDRDGVAGDRCVGREDPEAGVAVGLAVEGVVGDPDLADVGRILGRPDEVGQHDAPARAAGDVAAVDVVVAELDVLPADEDPGDDRRVGVNPEVIAGEFQMCRVFSEANV